MDAPTFLTTGDIARRLNVNATLVRHIIDTRDIAHVGRAGLVRLFPESAVSEVETALAARERRRRSPVPA